MALSHDVKRTFDDATRQLSAINDQLEQISDPQLILEQAAFDDLVGELNQLIHTLARAHIGLVDASKNKDGDKFGFTKQMELVRGATSQLRLSMHLRSKRRINGLRCALLKYSQASMIMTRQLGHLSPLMMDDNCLIAA